jgi:hypothetical protein
MVLTYKTAIYSIVMYTYAALEKSSRYISVVSGYYHN